MKKLACIIGVLVALASNATGQLDDASSILERSRNLTMADAIEATITLTITDKNGRSRVRTNSMVSKKFPDGTEKRLIRFIEPAEVQGTAILIHDYKEKQDDMWIYLPAYKKVRRIVTTEKGKSFMGSEFTNADISSPPSSDFESSHLVGSGTNGLYIIESIPADAARANEYGWSRRVSYFNMENLYLKKIEFHDGNGVHFKTINVTEIEHISGSVSGNFIIKAMSVINHRNGRSSSMIMNDISTTAEPDDLLFNAQNLGR